MAARILNDKNVMSCRLPWNLIGLYLAPAIVRHEFRSHVCVTTYLYNDFANFL